MMDYGIQHESDEWEVASTDEMSSPIIALEFSSPSEVGMSCNSGLLALSYQLAIYHPYVYWALEKK